MKYPELKSWHSLMGVINEISEDELYRMIEYEIENSKRWTIIERLHGRLTRLRRLREREEWKKRML